MTVGVASVTFDRPNPMLFRCALSACFAVSLAFADSSLNQFAGTWKENLSKSVRYSSTPMKFERLGDGLIRVTRMSGDTPIVSEFRADGKEHPIGSIPGAKARWIRTGDRTWTIESPRPNGVMVTMRQTLSADGRTLTVASTTTDHGRSTSTTTLYERESGAQDEVFGTWKPGAVKSDTADEIRLEFPATDRIVWTNLVTGSARELTLDGKEYPFTGPTTLPNITASIVRADDNTLVQTFKRHGKTIFTTTYKVSADGRTMTATGAEPDAKRASVTVYEKVVGASPFAGTWKLNQGLSKCPGNPVLPPEVASVVVDGPTLRIERQYTPVDRDPVKRSDTLTVDGKPQQGRYPGRFPAQTTFDAMVSRFVDASTIETDFRKGSGSIGVARLSVSADGKTLTMHRETKTDSGESHLDHFVFDRQ